MHLTCPNCGAHYDIPVGMVPAAGRHVQCSACHTRWFVRGSVEEPQGEEQILARLENWRPRPVAVPAPAPAPAPETPAAPPVRPAEPLRVVPTPDTATDDTPTDDAVGAAPARRERPTKPAERPTVARPALVPAAPTRPAPRLDLDGRPPAERAHAPQPRPVSRFPHGLVLVLALVLAALGVYRFGADLTAALPAAAPALDAYATTIDAWRADLEDLIAPYRPGRPG